MSRRCCVVGANRRLDRRRRPRDRCSDTMRILPDSSTGPFQIFPVSGRTAHNPDSKAVIGNSIDGLTGKRLRPRSRGSAGRTSLEKQLHHVQQELREEGRTLCVIVVDMQGETEDPKWSPTIDAQLRVLERADELGLDIYDVGMGIRKKEGEGYRLHRQPTTPRLRRFFEKSLNTVRIVKFFGNAVRGIEEDANTLPYAKHVWTPDIPPGTTLPPGTPRPVSLEQFLRTNRAGGAVVLGQEANQCVKSTIFGQNIPHSGDAYFGGYKPGLLDIGVSVVSAFGVLYDTSGRLEPIYEFESIGEDEEWGPATASATRASTASALSYPSIGDQ